MIVTSRHARHLPSARDVLFPLFQRGIEGDSTALLRSKPFFVRSAEFMGMAGVLRVSPPSRGGESLFVNSNKKGRKNAAQLSRYSCASRPGRGLADASIRAANAGHPWPAPAGLIRPGLRCSGVMKGKLARLAGYAGIARDVGQSPTSRQAKYPSRAPLSVATGRVDWPGMANRGARHRKWLAPTLEGVTDSGDKRVVGSPFLRHVFWASKKCDSRHAPLPEKKCGLIGARNGYHWDCLVDQKALLQSEALNRTLRACRFRLTQPLAGWIKRSRSTVYGRNQVDPSPCFLAHPANEALIERHWVSFPLFQRRIKGDSTAVLRGDAAAGSAALDPAYIPGVREWAGALGSHL